MNLAFKLRLSAISMYYFGVTAVLTYKRTKWSLRKLMSAT